MPRVCDTAALCQGQTPTCWYVAVVTFLWKSKSLLKSQFGITLPPDIDAFVEAAVSTCSTTGPQTCLNIPPAVLSKYTEQKYTAFALPVPEQLVSGDPSKLLSAIMNAAGYPTAAPHAKTPPTLLRRVLRDDTTRVLILAHSMRKLGFSTTTPPVTPGAGAILLQGMLAELRESPDGFELIGAFVHTRNTATNRGHVITIVRCGTERTFMICDSATAECWDGSTQRPLAYGLQPTREFRRVSFVYGRLRPPFIDAATRV